MIKTLFLSLFAFASYSSGAQTKLTPQIISSGGGISKFPGIELEWTLGEASIGAVASSDRLYTVGFHQPILVIPAKPELTASLGKITVFPNPVKDKLIVEVKKEISETFTLVLSDMHGRTLLQRTVTGISNIAEVPFLQVQPGIYLLRAYDSNKKLINTFKITKGK